MMGTVPFACGCGWRGGRWMWGGLDARSLSRCVSSGRAMLTRGSER